MEGVGIKEICKKYFLPKSVVVAWVKEHNGLYARAWDKYIFSDGELEKLIKDCVDDVRLKAVENGDLVPINLSDIARELRSYPKMVSRVAKEMDIEESTIKWDKNRTKTYFATSEQIDSLKRRILDRKLKRCEVDVVGVREISEKFFIGHEMVRRWARDNDVARSKSGNKLKYSFTQTDIDKFVKDCVSPEKLFASENKLTPVNVSKLAKSTHISIVTAYRIVRQIGFTESIDQPYKGGKSGRNTKFFATKEQLKMFRDEADRRRRIF